MQEAQRTARYGMDALLKTGADKAQCTLTLTEKHEVNVDSGEFSLIRTTFDTSVDLTAVKDGRKGTETANKLDRGSLDEAASEALDTAEASQPDDANDIAEKQPPEGFSQGADAPDLDKMHHRVRELLSTTRARFPKTILQQVFLDFTKTTTVLVNSNGVDFESTKSAYHFDALFSSRDGEKVSSYNYSLFSMRDLDRPLVDCGSLEMLLRQSGEQTSTQPVEGKFVGDVVITPDCLGYFLEFLIDSITDGAMISGTSAYKDSLGKAVASPLLSLHSHPVSDEICGGYFVTPDGYKARNCTIVDRGILRSYLLSLYGSKKTGNERAANAGGAWIVDKGDASYEEMVKSVKRGILLARLSGGATSVNGDFSGVAKNSYLIEDGQIRYPISESMVSGNVAEILKNIVAVSRERVDSGDCILPWVAVSGATISGK